MRHRDVWCLFSGHARSASSCKLRPTSYQVGRSSRIRFVPGCETVPLDSHADFVASVGRPNLNARALDRQQFDSIHSAVISPFLCLHEVLGGSELPIVRVGVSRSSSSCQPHHEIRPLITMNLGMSYNLKSSEGLTGLQQANVGLLVR